MGTIILSPEGYLISGPNPTQMGATPPPHYQHATQGSMISYILAEKPPRDREMLGVAIVSIFEAQSLLLGGGLVKALFLAEKFSQNTLSRKATLTSFSESTIL